MWQLPQARHKQAQRVHRLAQVVTGRSQKTRLGQGCLLGFFLLLAQGQRCRGNALLQFVAAGLQPLRHHIEPLLHGAQRVIGRDPGARRQLARADAIDQPGHTRNRANHATPQLRRQQGAKQQPPQGDGDAREQHLARTLVQRRAGKLDQHITHGGRRWPFGCGLPQCVDMRCIQIVKGHLTGKNRLQQQLDLGAGLKLLAFKQRQARRRRVAGLTCAHQKPALGIENGHRPDIRLTQGATRQGLQVADVA